MTITKEQAHDEMQEEQGSAHQCEYQQGTEMQIGQALFPPLKTERSF
ncbi:predicted ATPase [Zymobacter palmae]|uniref:Predicted ATPase n=1 Tax=Zymobacter palmae TaxID=33074 RepID=A0A348HF99_9GAMM|nr:predicted ATPase [Zymobacter palmae]